MMIDRQVDQGGSGLYSQRMKCVTSLVVVMMSPFCSVCWLISTVGTSQLDNEESV